MVNSDRFLASFNKIEKLLKRLYAQDHYIPFQRLVDLMSKNNAVVRRFRDDLKELAELRNAIVHERTDPVHTIAEPHDSTVSHILRIEQLIAEPPRVIPLFARPVKGFDLTDSITEVLRVIKLERFSQFPIYENGRFRGLLSDKGIAFWLAQQLDSKALVFSDIPIHNVLASQKNRENYEFIDRNTTLYEVQDIFDRRAISRKPRLDALLITHNGDPDQALLGIVTPWDLMGIED